MIANVQASTPSTSTSTNNVSGVGSAATTSTTPSICVSAPTVSIQVSMKTIKEGWLMKRGEHIKNWRRRYFVLRDDGTFYGYKTKPANDNQEPLNNFTVRDCQLMKVNKPKPYTFVLRGLQWTTVVERMFYVETAEERDDWLKAIQSIANSLKGRSDDDCEVMDVSDGACMATGVYDPVLKRYLRSTANKHRNTSGRKISLDDFELLKVLGKGTFGKVILCREKATNQFHAIKILKKAVILQVSSLHRKQHKHIYTKHLLKTLTKNGYQCNQYLSEHSNALLQHKHTTNVI